MERTRSPTRKLTTTSAGTLSAQDQRRKPVSRQGAQDIDAEMRQLLSDIRYLESSARVLQSRLDIVSAALSETNSAVHTLEGNRDAGANSEALIPIGSGSFVKARLAEPSKAVIGIGAGVCIEKNSDDAIKDLRLRESELEKARGVITNQLEQVLAQVDAYRGRLNEVVRQKGGGVEIV